MAKKCFKPAFLAMTALSVCFIAGCQRVEVYPPDEKPAVKAPIVHYEDLASATQHTSFEVGETLEPCISRSGTTLLFASNRHGPTFDIFAKEIGGETTSQVTTDPADDRQPSLSPDGGLVAFVSNRKGNWDIFVKSMEPGSPEFQLTTAASDDIHPSWSPDGKRIAYCTLNKRNNTWELRIIRLEQKGISIYSPGVEGLFPEWSPAVGSETILFQRPRGRVPGLFTLWTVQSDGRKLTEILESTQWATVSPTWTADGKWMVFSALPSSDAAVRGAGNLFLVRADGRYLTKIGKGAYPQLGASCSPDGSIFFTAARGGAKNIWSIRPDYNGLLPAESREESAPEKKTRPAPTSGKQT